MYFIVALRRPNSCMKRVCGGVNELIAPALCTSPPWLCALGVCVYARVHVAGVSMHSPGSSSDWAALLSAGTRLHAKCGGGVLQGLHWPLAEVWSLPFSICGQIENRMWCVGSKRVRVLSVRVCQCACACVPLRIRVRVFECQCVFPVLVVLRVRVLQCVTRAISAPSMPPAAPCVVGRLYFDSWSTWSAGCSLVYPGRFSRNSLYGFRRVAARLGEALVLTLLA